MSPGKASQALCAHLHPLTISMAYQDTPHLSLLQLSSLVSPPLTQWLLLLLLLLLPAAFHR
jgi:hypothetical protein